MFQVLFNILGLHALRTDLLVIVTSQETIHLRTQAYKVNRRDGVAFVLEFTYSLFVFFRVETVCGGYSLVSRCFRSNFMSS